MSNGKRSGKSSPAALWFFLALLIGVLLFGLGWLLSRIPGGGVIGFAALGLWWTGVLLGRFLAQPPKALAALSSWCIRHRKVAVVTSAALVITCGFASYLWSGQMDDSARRERAAAAHQARLEAMRRDVELAEAAAQGDLAVAPTTLHNALQELAGVNGQKVAQIVPAAERLAVVMRRLQQVGYSFPGATAALLPRAEAALAPIKEQKLQRPGPPKKPVYSKPNYQGATKISGEFSRDDGLLGLRGVVVKVDDEYLLIKGAAATWGSKLLGRVSGCAQATGEKELLKIGRDGRMAAVYERKDDETCEDDRRNHARKVETAQQEHRAAMAEYERARREYPKRLAAYEAKARAAPTLAAEAARRRETAVAGLPAEAQKALGLLVAAGAPAR